MSWIEIRLGLQELGALPKLYGGDMQPEEIQPPNTPHPLLLTNGTKKEVRKAPLKGVRDLVRG